MLRSLVGSEMCIRDSNQGRVVSLSKLSLLSACVRLCQLREVHHSLQQSLNPWSRTQSAATDGSPACCTSSPMLRVCVMLRVRPSQSSVRSLLELLLAVQTAVLELLLAVQTAVLVLFGPSCLGHYRPLQLLHAHCLGLVLLSVCVFSKTMYLDRQRYTVFWP